MTYRGHVKSGQIMLDESARLPENARVYVIIADPQDDRSARIRTPRLADPRQFRDFKKQIVELPGNAKL